MNKHLVGLFLLAFLSGCTPTLVPATVSVPETTKTPTATASIVPTEISNIPSTSTLTSVSLPDGLVVVYLVEDSLWIWKQNSARLLVEQKGIFDPQLSDDGQWIVFQQEYISPVNMDHSEEVWAIRTDGSELHRLLSPDDLIPLAGEEELLVNDIGWLPDRHQLLFNTKKIIEGPPERWPVFDLYLLDLSGRITRLADPGLGGKFIPSPNGLYIAVVTDSRIGIIDLESGGQRVFFEFDRLWLGCECLHIPEVVWDPQSQFVITSIPPQKLHYPEEYAGEPEQVWRLFVNGQVELVAQWKPLARVSGIAVDPTLQHFFYLHNSCSDAMGMLYVYDLASTEEDPFFCVWELPQWAPDGEHFIYNWDGLWRLGSVFDVTAYGRPLDVLNVPTDPDVQVSPQLTWMNDQYFLLTLRSSDSCTLSIATLEGIVAEIIRTPPNSCPDADFSLPQ